MTLESFIDKLFESIFSADDSSVSVAIKYLFDLFDLAAAQHAITDPDVVHAWKSNRFSSNHHHHHYHDGRVAGEGRRVIAPPCPRSTARLQSSPVGRRVESFHSWSTHLFRGRPGGRRHVWSGGRLSDSLMCS